MVETHERNKKMLLQESTEFPLEAQPAQSRSLAQKSEQNKTRLKSKYMETMLLQY